MCFPTAILSVRSVLLPGTLPFGSRPFADDLYRAEPNPMEYDRQTLDAAHRHSSNHRAELEQSDICGCFYCRATFTSTDIEEWEDKGGTALCPHCGVDSVIGSASGYPAGEQSFLSSMHDRWFG